MNEQKVGKIFSLIPKIMSDVGAITKDRRNTQGSGYMFRGIDDVYNALQPQLAKHGVFFVPEVISREREERQSKAGGTLIYTILRVKFSFFADDGSSFVATTEGEAMDSGDKSCNKSMSSALKYALFQVFCIPTEEEKDSETQTHEIAPKVTAKISQRIQDNLPPEAPKKVSLPKTETPSDPLDYVIRFGKFKGTKMRDHSVGELNHYGQYLVNKATEEKKPIDAHGAVGEFLSVLCQIPQKEDAEGSNFDQQD